MYKFFLVVLFFAASVLAINNQVLTKKIGVQRGNVSLQQAVFAAQIDSNYVLGPGDFLDLFFEDYYFSAQINPDGTIAIDGCGAVVVGGKTLAEAKTAILELTSKRYDPAYTFIQISRLKVFRITVMGAFAGSGQMNVESQMKLSTIVHAVGGFLPNADKENVLIIRNGGKDTLKVNYVEVMRSGNFAADPELMIGDVVYAPYVDEQKAVSLLLPSGNVSVPYKEGRTIREYYNLATGENIENGGFKSVRIKSLNGEQRISIPEASKKTVDVGAEIHCIGEAGTNEFVYVGGAVAMMGKVPYNPDYNALDYIAASGVTPITGSWDQVRVVRGDRETLNVNATGDVILPGDYIEIPKSTYETFKDFTMFLASLLTVVSSTFIIYMNYK